MMVSPILGEKVSLWVDNNAERRTTDDGLLIYTAEELNVGKGGDTEDCPFDCWCCF